MESHGGKPWNPGPEIVMKSVKIVRDSLSSGGEVKKGAQPAQSWKIFQATVSHVMACLAREGEILAICCQVTFHSMLSTCCPFRSYQSSMLLKAAWTSLQIHKSPWLKDDIWSSQGTVLNMRNIQVQRMQCRAPQEEHGMTRSKCVDSHKKEESLGRGQENN